MESKHADIIVFNDILKKDAGFDSDANEVTIIDRKGEKTLPRMSKDDVAAEIFDRVVELKKI
jgi:phosphopantothenoylcysteine decarboxylase/phosphopantothenate--cysteine ligase